MINRMALINAEPEIDLTRMRCIRDTTYCNRLISFLLGGISLTVVGVVTST